MRHRIPLTDREIAGKLLMRLADHPVSHHEQFCLSWAYDYDQEFLLALAKDIKLPSKFPTVSYMRRVRKVCRHLENCGILYGRVSSCHAEYLGEPRTLKSYQFSDPSYVCRLAPQKYPHYKPMGKTETELQIFLDRAYEED